MSRGMLGRPEAATPWPEAVDRDGRGLRSAAPSGRARLLARAADATGAAALVALALGWVVPLLWTIAVALRPPDVSVAAGSAWFGGRLTLENFAEVWERAPFALYYLNSLSIVLGILAVQLVTVSLAGYAFARRTFYGRDVLLLVLLLQILVPSAALLVPNYNTIRLLGLFDTRLAVMLPFFASAFGTFLMRQAFRQVPHELEDAARIDGANWLQTLWYVLLPLARPSLVAFGLVSVSFHWSDFLWPLVVTNSHASRPLTVGLATLVQMGESGAQWPLVTAGTLIVVAPLLLAFLLFQRQFVNGFLRSGLG
jgi:sn-glycerol 3-phosphate transport system permease protein